EGPVERELDAGLPSVLASIVTARRRRVGLVPAVLAALVGGGKCVRPTRLAVEIRIEVSGGTGARARAATRVHEIAKRVDRDGRQGAELWIEASVGRRRRAGIVGRAR